MTLGHKNLSEIVAAAGDIVQDTSTARASSLKASVNRRYREALASDRWPPSLRTDETGLRIASIADLYTFESGEKEAPMPHGCARVESIQIQGVATPPLEWREQRDFYDTIGTTLTTTGIPLIYTDIGTTAQFRRLSAAGTLTCYSNVSANDNQRTARVYFRPSTEMVADDAWQDVGGAFSTGVAMSQACMAGYPIIRVELPVGWVGSFSMQDGAGFVLVSAQGLEFPQANVNSTRQSIERRLIRVWPVPAADYPATVSWWREADDLTEDEDTPIIPIAEYLIHAAAADIFRQMHEADQAVAQEQLAGRALRQAEKQFGQTRTTFAAPRMGNVASMTGVSGWRH